MSIWFTDDAIQSDGTCHTARALGDGWELSWLPGQILSRDQAISGMTIAETMGQDAGELQADDGRWPLLNALAAELGLTGSDAADELAGYCCREDPNQLSLSFDDSSDDGWDQGQISPEVAIPAGIAVGLPLALAPISPLAAALSLLVSVVLVFLARAIHREAEQRQVQAVRAERILAEILRPGGDHGDR
jgi:hypothetical protein